MSDYTQTELCKILDTTKNTVRRYAEKLGLTPKRVGRTLLYTEVDGEKLLEAITNSTQHLYLENKKKCTGCGEVLDTSLFTPRAGRPGRVVSQCRECCAKKTRKSRREFTVEQKLRTLLPESKRKDVIQRQKISCTITLKQLISKYENQKGLCYYTQIPMTLTSGRHTVSLDRVVPSLGYTDENTVLCLDVINRMKLDSSVDDFVSLCAEVVKHRPDTHSKIQFPVCIEGECNPQGLH
jgi:DNA-binding transcriptional MerR regulator